MNADERLLRDWRGWTGAKKWGQTALSAGVGFESVCAWWRGALGQSGQAPFFARCRVVQGKTGGSD